VIETSVVKNLLSSQDSVLSLIHSKPVVAFSWNNLRQILDHMLEHNLKLIPIVDSEPPYALEGLITRTMIDTSLHKALKEYHQIETTVDVKKLTKSIFNRPFKCSTCCTPQETELP